MWETVELREIRVFLVLAEELHFRRTADRLGLTQSRVSQSLRSLEHKLGLELVHRTSRRVTLSPAGERFREEVGSVYGELVGALQRTHEVGLAVSGELRLGAHNAAAVGARLLGVIDAFEAANERCSVRVIELSFGDRFHSLRRGEIDLMLTRLPFDEPDLVVGPIVDREPRVLAVAHDHPLAGRAAVSIEDLADYDVGWADGLISQISDAFCPGETPSGRPIRRVRLGIGDVGELIVMVARGKIVNPTVSSFATHYGHPNVRYIPITDMPPAETVLVWRRRNSAPAMREFIGIARRALHDHDG
ncbi:LysR family transcriptional regulator [Solirubrobacter ginsenosidimutans]|uniref:LysR family transcriptional regulator n=1 Tax=Solirubrobacter ginsenosidimutans TaxID=490573 RepID=A0A9X3RXT2_9ACTN|nr:LysR family transcriptional regulator [Solirubrobacter ginsenosidimutans]MDA0158880.1 LysR family transcriptional regulator [Solirubrobacter ginsenosidimutans]